METLTAIVWIRLKGPGRIDAFSFRCNSSERVVHVFIRKLFSEKTPKSWGEWISWLFIPHSHTRQTHTHAEGRPRAAKGRESIGEGFYRFCSCSYLSVWGTGRLTHSHTAWRHRCDVITISQAPKTDAWPRYPPPGRDAQAFRSLTTHSFNVIHVGTFESVVDEFQDKVDAHKGCRLWPLSTWSSVESKNIWLAHFFKRNKAIKFKSLFDIEFSLCAV